MTSGSLAVQLQYTEKCGARKSHSIEDISHWKYLSVILLQADSGMFEVITDVAVGHNVWCGRDDSVVRGILSILLQVQVHNRQVVSLRR
jgi:hypothetical protein